MPRQTIYEHRIPGSAHAFRWRLNEEERVPVLLTPRGEARHLNSPADDVQLADILDAIMVARRAGLYRVPHESQTPSRELYVEPGPGHWNQTQWDAVVFSEMECLDLAKIQEAVDGARRLAEKRRRRAQNTLEVGGETFYYFEGPDDLAEYLAGMPSHQGEFRGPGWYGIIPGPPTWEVVPAWTMRAVLAAKRDALQGLIDALDKACRGGRL